MTEFDREIVRKSILKQEEEKVSKNLEVGIWEVYAKVWGKEWPVEANFSITLFVHVLIDFISLGLLSIDYSSSEPLSLCVPITGDSFVLTFHAYDGILYSILIT